MTIGGFKTEINLNTVVTFVGFLITFGGIISVWNGMVFRQTQFEEWIAQHKIVHESITSDIKDLRTETKNYDELALKLAQAEKSAENISDRLGRMSENYSNQFGDIRNTLGTITVQLALTNQSLNRLEALNKLPTTPAIR